MKLKKLCHLNELRAATESKFASVSLNFQSKEKKSGTDIYTVKVPVFRSLNLIWYVLG
jgi:hypothetical protein